MRQGAQSARWRSKRVTVSWSSVTSRYSRRSPMTSRHVRAGPSAGRFRGSGGGAGWGSARFMGGWTPAVAPEIRSGAAPSDPISPGPVVGSAVGRGPPSLVAHRSAGRAASEPVALAVSAPPPRTAAMSRPSASGTSCVASDPLGRGQARAGRIARPWPAGGALGPRMEQYAPARGPNREQDANGRVGPGPSSRPNGLAAEAPPASRRGMEAPGLAGRPGTRTSPSSAGEDRVPLNAGLTRIRRRVLDGRLR